MNIYHRRSSVKFQIIYIMQIHYILHYHQSPSKVFMDFYSEQSSFLNNLANSVSRIPLLEQNSGNKLPPATGEDRSKINMQSLTAGGLLAGVGVHTAVSEQTGRRDTAAAASSCRSNSCQLPASPSRRHSLQLSPGAEQLLRRTQASCGQLWLRRGPTLHYSTTTRQLCSNQLPGLLRAGAGQLPALAPETTDDAWDH